MSRTQASSADMNFRSRRSVVYGRRGIVATSQPLAVAAGLEILEKGGNAADAAIAVAAALNVTEPTSTGIGGDCFALYYDAHKRQVSALNGSGRAPHALSLERLRAEGLDHLPPFHPYTITIPGACAGWEDLITRHGRLDLARALQPAIRLAADGYPVSPVTAHFWHRAAGRQLASAAGGDQMLLNGRAPRAGEIFRNPGLARTFERVADGGAQAFYTGEIAEAIVAIVREAGGCLALEDLAAHQSTWDTPIQTTYRGLRFWECPPNGQGLAALLALNVLEGFDLGHMPPLSTRRLHLVIEAMRLAFADTRWYVTDPAFNPAPLAQLLSKDYAAARRALIDPQRATLDQIAGTPTASSDTVYLAVVDGEGNACSFINSNYMGFGTGIAPRGWGFTLQNRGHNFSLDAGHPNALAPGKRPYHTIIPALATLPEPDRAGLDELHDSLYACFGVMGGFMQPQGHVQVAIALADDRLDPQAALDRPRLCIEDGSAGGAIALEAGIPARVRTDLGRMGHVLRSVRGHERALFGRGQVILRNQGTGVLCAGSDPRADGCAMTY
jgi:gamma-glutamyltranspeptidase/glutathione hydrolase